MRGGVFVRCHHPNNTRSSIWRTCYSRWDRPTWRLREGYHWWWAIAKWEPQRRLLLGGGSGTSRSAAAAAATTATTATAGRGIVVECCCGGDGRRRSWCSSVQQQQQQWLLPPGGRPPSRRPRRRQRRLRPPENHSSVHVDGHWLAGWLAGWLVADGLQKGRAVKHSGCATGVSVKQQQQGSATSGGRTEAATSQFVASGFSFFASWSTTHHVGLLLL